MTEPSNDVARHQQALNDAAAQALVPLPELPAVEAPDLPPLPMRSPRERLLGAALLIGVLASFAYAITHGRLEDLQAHATLVLPVTALLVFGGVALLMPIPVVAEIVGLSRKHGEKIRRGSNYAGIIQPNGDLHLEPIQAPVVLTKTKPPGLYEPTNAARVRVTKTIKAGSYLTIFNHNNPQPVNGQEVRGFTAAHAHNLIGGILTAAVSRAWAARLGLALDRRRVLLLLAGLVGAYFLYQWYQGRF